MSSPIVEYVPAGPNRYEIVRHLQNGAGPQGRTACGGDITAFERHTRQRYVRAATSTDCPKCAAPARNT